LDWHSQRLTEVKFPLIEPAASLGTPAREGGAGLAWRVLTVANLLRLLAPLLLAVLFMAMTPAPVGRAHPDLFAGATVAYFLRALMSFGDVRRRWPNIPLQALTGVCVDVLVISLLAYASGGVSSGLVALLVLSIGAASSIVRQGLALLFATIAALALLVEQGFTMFVASDAGGGFVTAGIAGVLIFVVTLGVGPLARRLWETEYPMRLPDVQATGFARSPQDAIPVMEFPAPVELAAASRPDASPADEDSPPPRARTRPERIELTAWSKEFVTEFWLANEIDSLTLRLSSPGRDVVVQFDAANLHQLLWDLCESAVERCRDAGTLGPSEIRIDRHAATQRPILEILDRAPRIAAFKAARIFEPTFSGNKDAEGPRRELLVARALAQNNGAILTYEPRTGGGAILRLEFTET
jgi:hypothetical protein